MGGRHGHAEEHHDECAECFPGSAGDAKAHRERDELRLDNERLRGLIAKAEWAGQWKLGFECPWCKASRDSVMTVVGGQHAADCPAFSAPGVVR